MPRRSNNDWRRNYRCSTRLKPIQERTSILSFPLRLEFGRSRNLLRACFPESLPTQGRGGEIGVAKLNFYALLEYC